MKELEFTEGRGTGVPKMRRAAKRNGSPEPTFYTDEGRLCFWTEIKIHPEFLSAYVPVQEAQVKAQVEAYVKLTETELKILQICERNPIGNNEIVIQLGYKILSGNVKKALQRLKELTAIAYTIPEKPRSQNQQYRITERGKLLLEQK